MVDKYDLSVVLGEPIEKIESRIVGMSEKEARYHREKLDNLFGKHNEFVRNKNIQDLWMRLNDQLKEAGELSLSDWQEQESAEAQREILEGGFTSRNNIWKNKTIRTLIIKNNGLPESVSIDTAIKLNPNWRHYTKQILEDKKMLNRKNRVPIEIAMDSVLSEYGIEGDRENNAIDQAAKQADVLLYTYMKSKNKHKDWKPNNAAIGRFILSRVKETQAKRTPEAINADKGKTAKNIVDINDPRWYDMPNRYDIPRIDTSQKATKSKKKGIKQVINTTIGRMK